MFNNTIQLYPDTSGPSASWTPTLVDTDNGASVREILTSGGNRLQLRLQRTSTKENSTVQTNRYLVRLTRIKPDTNEPLKNVSGFVQLVIGVPQGASVTSAEVVDLVTSLFWLLCVGGEQVDNGNAVDPAVFADTDASNITSAIETTVGLILAGHL